MTAHVTVLRVISTHPCVILNIELNMDPYNTYEDTVESNKVTLFENYNIYTVEQVKAKIAEVPEKFYHLPEGKPRHKAFEKPAGSKGTNTRTSPCARVLVLDDNRKAKEIEIFLKENCNRTLMPTSHEGETRNCLVEAVFLQFSNKTYMLEAGYTDIHLRYQTIIHICENYGHYYDRLNNHLSESFKGWLERILDCRQDLEDFFLVPVRQLCRVCFIFSSLLQSTRTCYFVGAMRYFITCHDSLCYS